MYPILLSTPWFNIYSYGLLVAAGYTIGTIWILREARQAGLDYEAIFDMMIIQLVVGIMGSRLLFLIEYTPEKLTFSDFFSFEQGGLTYYGAVISSFISNLLYLKIRRMPFWHSMDCVGLGLPLGVAVARIGCLLNGCCYGTACSMPWGMPFPAAGKGYFHPTQLYESICALMIFFILQYGKKWRKNYGDAFLASMALYGFFRFFIEFYRAENPVVIFGLTLSQLLGISAMVLSLVIRWKIDSSRKLRIIPAETDCSLASDQK